jgi:hypothetical protein
MKHPFADRLDVLMWRFFEYIRSKTTESDNGKDKFNWIACKSIYKGKFICRYFELVEGSILDHVSVRV